jgi:hypothetical protein
MYTGSTLLLGWSTCRPYKSLMRVFFLHLHITFSEAVADLGFEEGVTDNYEVNF